MAPAPQGPPLPIHFDFLLIRIHFDFPDPPVIVMCRLNLQTFASAVKFMVSMSSYDQKHASNQQQTSIARLTTAVA